MAQVSQQERQQKVGVDCMKEGGVEVLAGLFKPSRPKPRTKRDGTQEAMSRGAYRRLMRSKGEE